MKKLLTFALVAMSLVAFAAKDKMPAWAIKEAKKSINADIKKLSIKEMKILWRVYGAALDVKEENQKTYTVSWATFLETAKPFYGGYVFLRKGPSEECICNYIKLMYASTALPENPFMLWADHLAAGDPELLMSGSLLIIVANKNKVLIDCDPGMNYVKVDFVGIPPLSLRAISN